MYTSKYESLLIFQWFMVILHRIRPYLALGHIVFQLPFDTFRENRLRRFWFSDYIFLYTYNRCAFYMTIGIYKYECTYIFGTQNIVFSFKTAVSIWT